MNDTELRGLNEVRIKREDLITKLKENRTAHAQIFADAMDGYFSKTAKLLANKSKQIENKIIVTAFAISIPKDHTNDYDKLIAMLEMSLDEELELSTNDFNRYVLDEWILPSEREMLHTYALSSSNSANYLVS